MYKYHLTAFSPLYLHLWHPLDVPVNPNVYDDDPFVVPVFLVATKSVVGNISTARILSFVGCEWWIVRNPSITKLVLAFYPCTVVRVAFD